MANERIQKGVSRRGFLKGCAALGGGAALGMTGAQAEGAGGRSVNVREYHVSLSIDALSADPELAGVIRDAGVGHVWLACFFHGNWHHSIDDVLAWKARLEKAGMAVHNITVPLGHPTFTDTQPDYMPQVPLGRWKPGVRPDGRTYRGVSLHAPATEENVAALRRIKTTDPKVVFVDDDFRLAPSPDDIGGCFCPKHRERFLQKHAYSETQWQELLEAVHARELTPLLRAWLNDTCDELTASFRAQQEALAPQAQLGIMVMYLGSEKAGIRLTDYCDVPFRVGELMFNDASFAPIKGKTNELFSALFHRRFVEPGLAYSETTAWPPDKLSAANMAAKLAVSTICDVRNTMFMSGNTPFPRTHWEVLAGAMQKQAALHEQLAGHTPRGPFKHYWGEHSRWAGDANPYSLFLASGVPFEVTDEPARDGWTFLADADARAAYTGRGTSPGTTFVCRPEAKVTLENARTVAESLPELFALKHEVLPELGRVPFVEQDTPAVCAWYPAARAVLLWNLAEQRREMTVRYGDLRRTATLDGLGCALLRDVGPT